MNTIAIGQTQSLSQANIDSSKPITLKFTQKGLIELDISCYGLDANDQLVDNDYEVYFNQLATVCGGIKLNENGVELTANTDTIVDFDVDLTALPAEVHCVLFAISAEFPLNQLCSQSYRQTEILTVEFIQEQQKTYFIQEQQKAVMGYRTSDFGKNNANLLLRISREDDSWVISNVAESFAPPELAALLYC